MSNDLCNSQSINPTRKVSNPGAAVMTVEEFREIVGTKADAQTDQEIHKCILRFQEFASASFRICRNEEANSNLIRLGESA